MASSGATRAPPAGPDPPLPSQGRTADQARRDQTRPPADDLSDPNAFMNRLLADPEFQHEMDGIRERAGFLTRMMVPDAELEEGISPQELLANLIILALDGKAELPDQKVNVEYLRNEQKLVLPQAIGMNPIDGSLGRCPQHAKLTKRYWQVASMTYAEIRGLVIPQFNAANVRAVVDALPVNVGTTLATHWFGPTFQTEFPGDDVNTLNLLFSSMSSALCFNCDLRDTGILNRADMYLEDDAWKTADLVEASRLKVKLQAPSLQYLAALNLKAVGNFPLAAWVRAYGVSLGIMPSPNSLTRQEWVFTVVMPGIDDVRPVLALRREFQRPLFSLCANIISMFGLFHLAKDHTFKTNDANMDRICTSYIQAIRTDVNSKYIDLMLLNKEATVRTGPHPFGLSQTYWLSQVMHKFHKLMIPLDVRHNVTPPPVQRLMIAHATTLEWANLPAGRALDTIFAQGYATMRGQIDEIMRNPPAFSSLHKLYGVPVQQYVTPDTWAQVEAMMPTIYGYIMTTHKNEKGEVDGLAYALSLKNVERDHKGLAAIWQNAWSRYGNEIEEAGLMDFIKHMVSIHAGASASSGTV